MYGFHGLVFALDPFLAGFVGDEFDEVCFWCTTWELCVDASCLCPEAGSLTGC